MERDKVEGVLLREGDWRMFLSLLWLRQASLRSILRKPVLRHSRVCTCSLAGPSPCSKCSNTQSPRCSKSPKTHLEGWKHTCKCGNFSAWGFPAHPETDL
ncbi:hypothetical protein OJAV_G00188100 [Oryzias javanicus]|uniref:Uncharacterized protein n=1 Tax=Oryzias javanicus TaxID=123683 RepID=A0A3S2MHD2_ORYJA|nr:hypothetical protein OJAV_G00188100 [Oryzias javanicus]